jgi:hypothetical protein
MWWPAKERFKVSVDLMAEPCLWRWEIRDTRTNKVVANSWTNDWMASQTSEDTQRAVAARLGSMARKPPDAAARHNLIPGANTCEGEYACEFRAGGLCRYVTGSGSRISDTVQRFVRPPDGTRQREITRRPALRQAP